MKMTYIKLALLAAGLLITAIAGLNLYLQWGAVGDPVAIDLARLEAGEKPSSRYVRVEQYVPRTDHMFAWQYQYETATTYEFFYPIISPGHPATADDVPLETFAMVVRPNSVTFDDDGNPIVKSGPLEGALAIGFDALEGPEKDFLRENYPNIDVHQVQVLVPGQKPWISVGSWIWLGFGVVVLLIGAWTFMMTSDD